MFGFGRQVALSLESLMSRTSKIGSRWFLLTVAHTTTKTSTTTSINAPPTLASLITRLLYSFKLLSCQLTLSNLPDALSIPTMVCP